MSTKTFKLPSAVDGLELNCFTWKTASKPKARILFIHGYSEFIGNYDNWFPRVAAAGYEVTMYDQRGHGSTAKTSEDFGISDEASIVGDLDTMVDYVTRDWTGPLVLWGFSMGAAICLNYMVIGKKRERFDLYISVGPYIRTSKETNSGLNAVKLWALPYLAKYFPNFVNEVSLNPEIANNDPEKWELYRKQPLRHVRSSARFMNDAVNRGKRLLDPRFISNIIDKPLLLSHGTGDKICDCDASKEFYEIVKLSDKTLDLYKGLPHEIQQCVEKDSAEHWRRVSEWLSQRLAKLENH